MSKKNKNPRSTSLAHVRKFTPSSEFIKLNPQFQTGFAKPPEVKETPGKRPRLQAKDKMSGPEKEYELHLQAQVRLGKIREYKYEALRLKVGENNCTYLVDFVVIDFDNKVTCIEIKGKRKWDDAIVKFKAASMIWGMVFRFEMWERTNERGWDRIL